MYYIVIVPRGYRMRKTKTYKIVYRFKDEGKTCHVSESEASSKKELRTQFDSNVVIKGIYTLAEWKEL